MDEKAEITLNAEEQAAVDRAKVENQKLILKLNQPADKPLDPMAILASDEGLKLIPKDAPTDSVMVSVPANAPGAHPPVIGAPFVLQLTHHHRFEFPPGVYEIPRFMLDHWWVKAHGVKEHAAKRGVLPVTLLGASTIKDPVEIGGDKVPLGTIVAAAQTKSGLSVADWNAKTEEERDEMISAEIKARQEAAKASAKPVAPKATAAT